MAWKGTKWKRTIGWKGGNDSVDGVKVLDQVEGLVRFFWLSVWEYCTVKR